MPQVFMETKKMQKALSLIILVAIFAFLPGLCLAKGPTAGEYGVVLNLSGKQRMLSQKMSKEVILIALNIEKEKNLKNLKQTSDLFNRTLKGLKNGDKKLRLPPTISKRIIRQLDKINTKYWKSFYKIVKSITKTKKVTEKQLKYIATANLPLLKNMNRCVKLYEKDASKAGLKSDPGLAVTINLAGKQRMLSQKMSKEFLLIAYGVDVKENKLNLFDTSSLFERTLKGLMDGDDTLDLPGTKNAKIRKQLEIVTGIWSSFKPVIERAVNLKGDKISNDQIKKLAKENLPLLKEMNIAVGMFEKEAVKK